MVLKRFKKHGTRFTIYLLAFMLLKASWWIQWKFGTPTIDQIVFHFQNGNEALADADPRVFQSFFAHVVLLPLLFAILTFALQQIVLSDSALRFIWRNRSIRGKRPLLHVLSRAIGIARFTFNHHFPMALLLFAGFILANQVALWTHLKNLEVSEFIDENYVPAANITAPKQKPNLVLIYVESLESGFGDPALMGKDLLTPLNAVTKDAYRFRDYEQTTGTGWTIAGIVSTQCGIPLKSHSLFDHNMQGEKTKSFLPGARCLGDVLASNGYQNVFLGGASLYFAGKGKFFAQHGYSTLYGKEEWSRAGYKEFNSWGLYDDALFKEAKAKVDALQKSRQPFNLTLLTVDTHPPEGHISPTCAKQGVTDYKGIVHCTAGLIADFVGYLKKRGYLKNTVVVILGDHLSGQTPVEANLAEAPLRTIYNRFLTPHKLDQNRNRIFHFGIFPSILYAMGFRFPDNRLGIGASGFGPSDPNFTAPDLDTKSFSELTAKASRKYMEFLDAH